MTDIVGYCLFLEDWLGEVHRYVAWDDAADASAVSFLPGMELLLVGRT